MSYVIQLDAKRRAAIPVHLLSEAGIVLAEPLVARADGHGRIVLETREAIAARLFERARLGRERTGRTDRADDSLMADREADAGR